MYLNVLKGAGDCSFVQPGLVAGRLTAKVHERELELFSISLEGSSYGESTVLAV